MKTKTKENRNTKTVWVIGSVMSDAGWVRGKVLEVGEGFRTSADAERWGRAALTRLYLPGSVAPSHFKIGAGY